MHAPVKALLTNLVTLKKGETIMLSIVNMKIYRKILMLAVLSVSLFVLSSTNQSASRSATAIPCCGSLFEICDEEYESCVLDCHLYIGVPSKYAECLGNCKIDQFNCYGDAEPCEPDPCGP